MRVKLKLTDIRSGQESLLLVTNLNTKGLLVQAARTLPIGNRVKLHLQFDEGIPAVDLLGEVHKIALRRGGGRGMILRFLDPPGSAIERISQFLERESNRDQEPEAQAAKEAPSTNQTMVVDLADPVNLPLRPSKPAKKKKKQKPLSATVDEEDFNQMDELLGGDTRMLALNEFESFAKTRKSKPWLRWVLLGGFSFLMVPLLLFLGERLQLFRTDSGIAPPTPPTVGLPEGSTSGTTPTAVPSEPPEESPRSLPEGAKGITDARIDSTSKQIEVILTATHEFPDPEIEKKMSPRRLILRFAKMDGLAIAPVVPVSQSPLLRIRSSQSGEGIQMIMDLYPVAFPEFEIKKRGTTLTIYLYR